MTVDEEKYLNWLCIGHYVWGGLVILFSSICLIHVAVGLVMAMGLIEKNGPPPVMGWLFVVMGGTVVSLGWTFGILNILSGRFLAARKKRLFSMVISGFNCLSVPFGTALGVLTMVVLERPTVKSDFDISGLGI